MLQLVKDHGPHLIQSMVDVKTAASAAVTTAGAVTIAVTEVEPVTIAADEWAVIAVIFSAIATGLFMLSNLVINMIKIYSTFKHED